LSPREVDDLPVLDFLILVQGIENRLEARKDAAEKGIWIP
jgi:hypothetical protein